MKRRELSPEEQQDAARLRDAWAAYKDNNPGVTQEWLGRETGLGSQSAVGQYLRAIVPLNLTALLSFCRVMRLSPGVISPRLAQLVPPTESQNDVGTPVIPIETGATTPEGYISVERYNLRFEAGSGHIQWEVEKEEEPRVYSLRYLQQRNIRPHNARRVKVMGDSMEPTLYDGDSALVDIGDTEIRDGKVYVLRYGDGFRIKRVLKRFDGSIVLVSDNKKYPEETISEELAAQFITILGRVRDRSGAGGLE
jgi:hypothetical protein